LEKAVDERSGMVVYLKIEPVFKDFSADPKVRPTAGTNWDGFEARRTTHPPQ
jgi:hypothetical protein